MSNHSLRQSLGKNNQNTKNEISVKAIVILLNI